MGPAGNLFNIRQVDGSIEEYAGQFWEVARRSATGKICLLVFFWGGLAKPFKSRMPYWNPEESLGDYLNLALHLSDSAFMVELALEPAPFRGAQIARSVPGSPQSLLLPCRPRPGLLLCLPHPGTRGCLCLQALFHYMGLLTHHSAWLNYVLCYVYLEYVLCYAL